MNENPIETKQRPRVEVDGLFTDGAIYESPELVELGVATSLLRGIIITRQSYDCGDNGYTDQRPTC